MTHAPADDTGVTWPAERFYWAVLDAPGLKGGRNRSIGGVLPPGLQAAFADAVPAEPSTLHAVFVPTIEGKALVCAAAVDELRSVIATTLTPQSLPPGVALAVHPASLNLLVGGFEPREQRVRRVRARLAVLAATAASIALVGIGLARRADHWNVVAADTREATAAMLRRALPGDQARPEMLGVRLANLQSAADSLARVKPAPDAAVGMASVLAAWPTSVPCLPQSISVNEGSVTISVMIEGDPSLFLKAFTPPEGWTLLEPRLNSSGSSTRVALDLRRVEPAKEPRP